jgi:predicted nuclease of predicted toxin-antitoxin system
VSPLSEHFIGTKHVRDTCGILADDIIIWNYAKQNNFVMLTKDNDFDERSQIDEQPCKIVHLVCGNKPSAYILDLLIQNVKQLRQFGDSDLNSCILKIS